MAETPFQDNNEALRAPLTEAQVITREKLAAAKATYKTGKWLTIGGTSVWFASGLVFGFMKLSQGPLSPVLERTHELLSQGGMGVGFAGGVAALVGLIREGATESITKKTS